MLISDAHLLIDLELQVLSCFTLNCIPVLPLELRAMCLVPARIAPPGDAPQTAPSAARAAVELLCCLL